MTEINFKTYISTRNCKPAQLKLGCAQNYACAKRRKHDYTLNQAFNFPRLCLLCVSALYWW